MIKIQNLCILSIGMQRIYKNGQCHKSYLYVDGFKWVEHKSQFNKHFIENYNEDNDEGYFLEVDVQYTERLHDLHNDLLLLPERMKIEKVEKPIAKFNLHDKKICYTLRNLK